MEEGIRKIRHSTSIRNVKLIARQETQVARQLTSHIMYDVSDWEFKSHASIHRSNVPHEQLLIFSYNVIQMAQVPLQDAVQPTNFQAQAQA